MRMAATRDSSQQQESGGGTHLVATDQSSGLAHQHYCALLMTDFSLYIL